MGQTRATRNRKSFDGAFDFFRRTVAAIRIGGIKQHQAFQQLRMIHRELRNGGAAQGMSHQRELVPP